MAATDGTNVVGERELKRSLLGALSESQFPLLYMDGLGPDGREGYC